MVLPLACLNPLFDAFVAHADQTTHKLLHVRDRRIAKMALVSQACARIHDELSSVEHCLLSQLQAAILHGLLVGHERVLVVAAARERLVVDAYLRLGQTLARCSVYTQPVPCRK